MHVLPGPGSAAYTVGYRGSVTTAHAHRSRRAWEWGSTAALLMALALLLCLFLRQQSLDQACIRVLTGAPVFGFPESVETAAKVKTLIRRGARPNLRGGDADGVTPLFLAAAAGDCELATLLLARGARPDQPAGPGHSYATPLMAAAAMGEEDMLRLLLNRGADPTAIDQGGSTATDYAGIWNAQPCRELLLRAGGGARRPIPTP